MTSVTPERTPSAAPRGDDSRRLTVAAWLMPLAFVVWFPLMFVAGYWLTDLMDVYPAEGATQEMTEIGLGGWIVAIIFGLVAGLPGWIGVGLAVAARRRGARWTAMLALVVNLLLAALFLISSLLPS
jgi:uncharacterized membrane protein